MDWVQHYPAYAEGKAQESEEAVADASMTEKDGARTVRNMSKRVEVADIGCGFGGLLFALAPKLPDTLLLGELWSITGIPGPPTDLSHRHGDQNLGDGVCPV